MCIIREVNNNGSMGGEISLLLILLTKGSTIVAISVHAKPKTLT